MTLLWFLSPIGAALGYATGSTVDDDPDDPGAGWRRLVLWLALLALVAYMVKEGVIGSLVDAFGAALASFSKLLAGLGKLVGV